MRGQVFTYTMLAQPEPQRQQAVTTRSPASGDKSATSVSPESSTYLAGATTMANTPRSFRLDEWIEQAQQLSHIEGTLLTARKATSEEMQEARDLLGRMDAVQASARPACARGSSGRPSTSHQDPWWSDTPTSHRSPRIWNDGARPMHQCRIDIPRSARVYAHQKKSSELLCRVGVIPRDFNHLKPRNGSAL